MTAIIVTFIISISLIVCVYIASHANITIAHKQLYDIVSDPVTHDDLVSAEQEAEKEDLPDFINIINEINKEFGGINYDE